MNTLFVGKKINKRTILEITDESRFAVLKYRQEQL